MILELLRGWGMVGALVAAVFLTVGLDRIDADARGAYIFRPLLIPGVLVIWPLVLWRWYLYETGTERWENRYDPPRKAHFTVGWLMPIGICLIILAGLSVRQTAPTDFEPIQLSAPPETAQ
ncbi:hypothetical protein [Roseobacter denitrificans]|uniref:hypothetical protein n=1 Tax=Roseobacter denitrificans TaxID=2434 RepID=UPI001FEA6F30|nr:hypothetical protein [Roseobacter denitrificans]